MGTPRDAMAPSCRAAEKGMAAVSDPIICSFCDKRVDDVEVMISASDEAYICAACIEIAWQVVLRRRGDTGVDILASPGRKSRARARQSTKPTEHQVAILDELLAGGHLAVGLVLSKQRWHLVDRDGSEWRDSIRSTTVARLMDEHWIERPDEAGEYRWSISAAGRLALSRHRVGDFGLVVLKGGAADS